MSFVVTLVPITAELLMLRSSYYGNIDDTDELYKEVVSKSKK